MYFKFLETYFFKISHNFIASAFFLPRQTLKNIDMPWQKPRHLTIAEANIKSCVGTKNVTVKRKTPTDIEN